MSRTALRTIRASLGRTLAVDQAEPRLPHFADRFAGNLGGLSQVRSLFMKIHAFAAADGI